jgi:hypothetical protein
MGSPSSGASAVLLGGWIIVSHIFKELQLIMDTYPVTQGSVHD